MNYSKNSILVFLVALLLLTNIAMLLYFTTANRPFSKTNHGDKRGAVTSFLQNEAGFSKDQLDRFDSLKKEHRAAIKPLFDELGKSKDKLYQLLGKPGISKAELETAADEIGKKQAALDLQFFQNFSSMRKLCTDQQLAKFDAGMPALASKMMQPWQRNNGFRKKDSADKNMQK